MLFFPEPTSSNSKGNDVEKKAQIYLTNYSKLYEYPIYLKTVAVNLEYSKIEVQKDVYTKGKYINIKLETDE